MPNDPNHTPRERPNDDRAYAASLIHRAHLYEPERRWLEDWQANHPDPEADPWICNADSDSLGLHMTGLLAWDGPWIDEHAIGFWRYKVVTTTDERGWPESTYAQLFGLNTFLDAIGVARVAGAEDEISGCPTSSNNLDAARLNAYEELAQRMLATFAVVTRHITRSSGPTQ